MADGLLGLGLQGQVERGRRSCSPPPKSRSRRSFGVAPKRGSSRTKRLTRSTKYGAGVALARWAWCAARAARPAASSASVRGDHAELDHLVEHDAAPGGGRARDGRRGRGWRATRMRPASRAAWARSSRSTAPAEVLVGGGLHAVGAVPEVDGVQVQLEDPLLGVLLLEVVGERGLLELAPHVALGVEELVLDVLLGDRRAALDDPALLGVARRRPGPPPAGRRPPWSQKRSSSMATTASCSTPGDPVEGDDLAVLLGVQGGDQRAVGGLDPRRLRARWPAGQVGGSSRSRPTVGEDDRGERDEGRPGHAGILPQRESGTGERCGCTVLTPRRPGHDPVDSRRRSAIH